MKRTRMLAVGSVLLALCPGAVLASDGVVALQTADPSCRDSSGDIFVDCENGTVTDSRTGLVWLQNANCLPFGDGIDWWTAMEFVAGLADMPEGSAAELQDCGLSDHSSPGEWRLPSPAEWEAMVADADAMGCVPTITNNAGTGCWADCSFVVPGVPVAACSAFRHVRFYYWSPTTLVTNPTNSWGVNLVFGNASEAVKENASLDIRVWPVRAGQ